MKGPGKSGLAVLVLLVAIAATPAHAAGDRLYSGKTAQKFRVTIVRGEGSITLLRFKIRLRCRDGSVLFDDLSDFEPATLKPGGRFGDLQLGTTDEVVWRGRLAGATVSGSLRVRDRLKSGVPCDSGSVGFAARRR